MTHHTGRAGIQPAPSLGHSRLPLDPLPCATLGRARLSRELIRLGVAVRRERLADLEAELVTACETAAGLSDTCRDGWDRAAWDRELIAEADALILGALHAGPPGRFTLQAAIAALHAQAPSYAATDWPQILALYGELLRVWPSPVVALNRAVALAEVDGPAAALAEVEALAEGGRLAGYRYLHATRADLLQRLGRDAEAAAAYRAALELAGNAAEQEFLAERLRALT